MDTGEKGLFVRVLELATGITATTTVIVLSYVAGMSAYELYQPAALQAQSITAASAAVNSTSAPAACQQEIATAAARGFPDTQSIVTDPTGLNFEDHCVAAVFNPAVTSLGPNNPGSYMCVGKTAKVTVTGVGFITETAVPNASVPAGTCIAVACGPADAGGLSGCIAANNLTSINGSEITGDLSSSQTTLVSDQGITGFTMNSEGSIVSESGNTANVLDSGANVEGLSGNTVSIAQTAPTEVPAGTTLPNPTVNSGTILPETPDSVATVPQNLPEAGTSPEVTTVPTETNVPASTNVTPPESLPGSQTNVPTQLPQANLDGPQATTPTLNNSAGDLQDFVANNVIQNASDVNAPETGWEQFVTNFDNGLNNVLSFFGFQPTTGAVIDTPPTTIGIRG